MTGLELLTLLVEYPNRPAAFYAERAIELGWMSRPADGRAMRHGLDDLVRSTLASERWGKGDTKTYVPSGKGRKVLGAVKRARQDGFVPYTQIEGVDYLVARALGRSV